MDIKQLCLKIVEFNNKTQQQILLEIIADTLSDHPKIAGEVALNLTKQIKEFELLKNSFILTDEQGEKRTALLPNVVLDFESKKAEMQVAIQTQIQKQKDEIETKTRLSVEKMKNDQLLAEAKREAEKQAKFDTGLLFGHWEMQYIESEQNEDIKIRFISTLDRDFQMVYTFGKKMSFIYPYITEIKEFMKDDLGMIWDGAWITSKWKTAFEQLALKWPDLTLIFESSKTFGKGRYAIERTNQLHNVFPYLHEVKEKIDLLKMTIK